MRTAYYSVIFISTEFLITQREFWFATFSEQEQFEQRSKEKFGAVVIERGTRCLTNVEEALDEIKREEAHNAQLAVYSSFGKEGFE